MRQRRDGPPILRPRDLAGTARYQEGPRRYERGTKKRSSSRRRGTNERNEVTPKPGPGHRQEGREEQTKSHSRGQHAPGGTPTRDKKGKEKRDEPAPSLQGTHWHERPSSSLRRTWKRGEPASSSLRRPGTRKSYLSKVLDGNDPDSARGTERRRSRAKNEEPCRLGNPVL